MRCWLLVSNAFASFDICRCSSNHVAIFWFCDWASSGAVISSFSSHRSVLILLSSVLRERLQIRTASTAKHSKKPKHGIKTEQEMNVRHFTRCQTKVCGALESRVLLVCFVALLRAVFVWCVLIGVFRRSQKTISSHRRSVFCGTRILFFDVSVYTMFRLKSRMTASS